MDLTGQARLMRNRNISGSTLGQALSIAAETVDLFRANLNGQRLIGIGIAAPEALYDDPIAAAPAETQRVIAQPSVARLEAQTGLPVFMESEGIAAAMGERLYGSAKDLSDFTYLFIGDELRAVTFLSNALYAGHRHHAGQIEHLVMNHDGPPCHCGRRGCLGRYLSQARFVEQLAIDPGENIDALDLRDHAPGMARFAAESGDALRHATDVLESILDPESVVIGGTVPAAALQALIDVAFPAAPSEGASTIEPRARIKLGATGGKCVALGAASTVMLTQFAPQYTSGAAPIE